MIKPMKNPAISARNGVDDGGVCGFSMKCRSVDAPIFLKDVRPYLTIQSVSAYELQKLGEAEQELSPSFAFHREDGGPRFVTL